MKSLIKKEFARRLKAARKDAGLKQDELSSLLGVEPFTISRWERGVVMPRDFDKLCEVLNKPPEYFMGSENLHGIPIPTASMTELDREIIELLPKVSESFKRGLVDIMKAGIESRVQTKRAKTDIA